MDIKHAYIASVDPMHFSHLNTFKESQCIIGEKVTLCIGINALKKPGLFSLEERSYIAHHFYGIPKEQIVLLTTKEIILNVVKNSKHIIRGMRTEKDLIELNLIAKHYDVLDQANKLLTIDVPENMRDISSSKLIEKIKCNQYRIEDNWIPENFLRFIEQKLNTKPSFL